MGGEGNVLSQLGKGSERSIKSSERVLFQKVLKENYSERMEFYDVEICMRYPIASIILGERQCRGERGVVCRN